MRISTRSAGRHGWLVMPLAATLIASCTASRPTATTAGPSPAGPAVATACPPAAGADMQQGLGHGATLWAWFMPTASGWAVGAEIKIVWRMTGSGELTMSATGPHGETVRPAWGPEAHSGSNFDEPGDEWGTGWVFPAAGCWTFHAARDGGQTGELAVRVG